MVRGHVDHALRQRRLQHRGHAARDLEVEVVVVDLDVAHPVESPEGHRIGCAREPEAHHPRRAHPEVLDRVGHHQAAVTDDGDPVGDALDLGERMG